MIYVYEPRNELDLRFTTPRAHGDYFRKLQRQIL